MQRTPGQGCDHALYAEGGLADGWARARDDDAAAEEKELVQPRERYLWMCRFV